MVQDLPKFETRSEISNFFGKSGLDENFDKFCLRKKANVYSVNCAYLIGPFVDLMNERGNILKKKKQKMIKLEEINSEIRKDQ